MNKSDIVFNRPDSDSYFQSALSELRAARLHEDCAIAANFAYDDRVSEEREKGFRAFCNGVCAGALNKKGLNRSQVKYFKENVRGAAEPVFLEDHNRVNLVGDVSKLELLHLMNLNGLDKVFNDAGKAKWRNSKGKEVFEGYPRARGPNSEEVITWLDEKLDPDKDELAEEFVGSVLELLNHGLKQYPFHPTWATAYDDEWHALLESSGADRWLERLGMGKTAELGHWIIALVYDASETNGRLYRPTVLDTNWEGCEWHYPSPICASPDKGGSPVDLDCSSDRLIPEFIHPQIIRSTKHFTASLRRRRSITRLYSKPINEARGYHRQLLSRAYPKLEATWMPTTECG